MIDYLGFYLIAIPVVLLTGISKGGFASGLGTLAVPLLTLVVDPRQAAAIMLPILCCMDVFSIHAYRRRWDLPLLKLMLPAAMLGILVGSLSFGMFNADHIRIMVGVLSLYFVAHFFLKARLENATQTAAGRNSGRFWGMLAGFTSFVAHAGGPPVSIYLFPLRLDKTVLVGTMAVFFTAVNLAKIPPYAMLGQLHGGNLMTSLLLLPLAPIGVRLGVWMHNKVPQREFYLIAYGLLFAAGIKLLYDGLSALL